MPRPYRIRPGFAFRLDDVTTKAGGDVIELEDDVAQAHPEKLDLADSTETVADAGPHVETTEP